MLDVGTLNSEPSNEMSRKAVEWPAGGGVGQTMCLANEGQLRRLPGPE